MFLMPMVEQASLKQPTSEQQARQALAEGRFQVAEQYARTLLSGGSGPVSIWKILASALREQGRFAETRDIQSMLVETIPSDLSMHFDLAETLLMLGDFERGWKEYRYRYSLAHTRRIERKVQVPRWDGRPLPGQSILIHDEQGYGDTFQFLRLMPQVKAQSQAKIILEINPQALPFAHRIEGIDEVIPLGQLPPHFDVHCELMSLPMALNLKMSDLPASKMPYLKTDPEYLQKWQERLKDLPRPLVALVWGGRALPNPKRSMPFSTLAPLAIDGITFLSIQKGPQAQETRSCPTGMKLVDLSDEINNFDDTAAILSIADLLISIDSAPVHLAGGLLRPAWVMLLNVADWRWFFDREDSPWYPSLRLFRQSERHETWDKVLDRIAKELVLWRDRFK